MARNDPQVNFRLPVELKQRLEAAAEKNNRSFKAEIEYRLDNWEDVVNQIDVLEESWEAARLSAEFHKQHADALMVEIGLANTRYENLELRYEEYRDQIAIELSELRSESLPQSLKKRIDRRASETGRTPQEEIVLALEDAFPPATETDAMISLLQELLGESPDEAETIAGDAIRQYVEYLKEERAAGRAEGAHARLNEVFTKTPEGRTVRVK